MDLHFFSEQMHRLKEVYGNRCYPEERAKLIWFEFKHLKDEDFKEGVSKLIMEKRQAPLVDDFRVALAGYGRSSKQEKIREIKARQYCNLCKNTGSVLQRGCDGLSYVRRCVCPLGDPGLCLSGDISRLKKDFY